MTFDEWKKAAAVEAEKICCAGDLFAADDPYEVIELAKEAFDKWQSPTAFAREIFEEDLMQAEHDDQMAAEALEWEGDTE